MLISEVCSADYSSPNSSLPISDLLFGKIISEGGCFPSLLESLSSFIPQHVEEQALEVGCFGKNREGGCWPHVNFANTERTGFCQGPAGRLLFLPHLPFSLVNPQHLRLFSVSLDYVHQILLPPRSRSGTQELKEACRLKIHAICHTLCWKW